jgi:hypothetical protein
MLSAPPSAGWVQRCPRVGWHTKALPYHARFEFNIFGITFGGRYDGPPIIVCDPGASMSAKHQILERQHQRLKP